MSNNAPDYPHEEHEGDFFHEGFQAAQEVIKLQNYQEDLETLDMLMGRGSEWVSDITDKIEVKEAALAQSKEDFRCPPVLSEVGQQKRFAEALRKVFL